MYCATNQFTKLNFIGPQNKPLGVIGLGKHNQIRFDPKLGHVTYAIRFIPCACTSCTSITYQPYITGSTEQKKISTNPPNITHTSLC